MTLLKSIKHQSYLLATTRHHRKSAAAQQGGYMTVTAKGLDGSSGEGEEDTSAVEEEVDGTSAPDIFPHSHNFHVPFFITIISIIELSIFLYQTIDLATSQGQPVTSSGPSPICSSLIYDPYRRYEPWRLITYTLVHSGYLHIATNIIVQLLLGLPLEIVHGPLRIGVIYVAGGLSGSLLTSITDPEQFLAGASGGVYALMLAHLPTLIMNWREMKTFFEWIVSTTVLSIGLVDFVVSIIQRYTSGGNGSIGYSAHIAGGLAGILIGMNVLRNFHHKRWEGYLRMVCFLLWVVSLVLCILANALFVGHFPLPNRDSIGDCVYYDVNYPFLQQRKRRMMMPTNT